MTVAKFCREKGLTPRQFADITGVSPKTAIKAFDGEDLGLAVATLIEVGTRGEVQAVEISDAARARARAKALSSDGAA